MNNLCAVESLGLMVLKSAFCLISNINYSYKQNPILCAHLKNKARIDLKEILLILSNYNGDLPFNESIEWIGENCKKDNGVYIEIKKY